VNASVTHDLRGNTIELIGDGHYQFTTIAYALRIAGATIVEHGFIDGCYNGAVFAIRYEPLRGHGPGDPVFVVDCFASDERAIVELFTSAGMQLTNRTERLGAVVISSRLTYLAAHLNAQ
jgi:hypothetical protein